MAQTTRVDVTLQVGQLAESVEVRAIAPLIQSTTSDIGETVQRRQVQTLPLNGRVFSQLMQLMPGTFPAGQANNTEASAGAGARSVILANANGMKYDGNTYTLDGILNAEPGNAYISIAPPIEAVEEFKVQTSNPSAEFGVFGGALAGWIEMSV